jgi:hypothetical protein
VVNTSPIGFSFPKYFEAKLSVITIVLGSFRALSGDPKTKSYVKTLNTVESVKYILSSKNLRSLYWKRIS